MGSCPQYEGKMLDLNKAVSNGWLNEGTKLTKFFEYEGHNIEFTVGWLDDGTFESLVGIELVEVIWTYTCNCGTTANCVELPASYTDVLMAEVLDTAQVEPFPIVPFLVACGIGLAVVGYFVFRKK